MKDVEVKSLGEGLLVRKSAYDEVVKENELLKKHKGLDVKDGKVMTGFMALHVYEKLEKDYEELQSKHEALKREIKKMLNNLNSEEGDVAYVEWDYVRRITRLLEVLASEQEEYKYIY